MVIAWIQIGGLGLLAAARADGQEAAREPRLLQVPWREDATDADAFAARRRRRVETGATLPQTNSHVSLGEGMLKAFRPEKWLDFSGPCVFKSFTRFFVFQARSSCSRFSSVGKVNRCFPLSLNAKMLGRYFCWSGLKAHHVVPTGGCWPG